MFDGQVGIQLTAFNCDIVIAKTNDKSVTVAIASFFFYFFIRKNKFLFFDNQLRIVSPRWFSISLPTMNREITLTKTAFVLGIRLQTNVRALSIAKRGNFDDYPYWFRCVYKLEKFHRENFNIVLEASFPIDWKTNLNRVSTGNFLPCASHFRGNEWSSVMETDRFGNRSNCPWQEIFV